MTDNPVKRKVGPNRFGSVTSVTARGTENIAENVRLVTPDEIGDRLHQLKRTLDHRTAPEARWINPLGQQEGTLEHLKQRQKYFEGQGVWSI